LWHHSTVEGGITVFEFGFNDPIVRSAFAALVGAVSFMALLSFLLD